MVKKLLESSQMRWVILALMAAYCGATLTKSLLIPWADAFGREKAIKKILRAQYLDSQDISPQSRAEVHQLLLTNQIYVPIDDILVDSKTNKVPRGEVFPVQKHCGEGIIYIWIPYQLYLPLVGEWTFERCFALRARDAR